VTWTLPRIGFLGLGALALTGCADLSYYWQAAEGQLDLWQRSHPIDDLLAAPDTSPAPKGSSTSGSARTPSTTCSLPRTPARPSRPDCNG